MEGIIPKKPKTPRMPRASTSRTVVKTTRYVSEEELSVHAYHIFKSKEGVRSVEDWIQAEQELQG